MSEETNVIGFPVAPRREAITQGDETKPKPKFGTRRVRVISSFAPAEQSVKAHTPEGSGVEVGKGVRASINRIGEYLDLIDGMRGEVDDLVLESQLGIIEGALASMCFMHAPPPKRHA